MIKHLKPNIITILLISTILFSFISDLEYRNVVGGDLKMLMPKDFIHIPKESYKLSYPGDWAPDDFYCNKDTSESIGFLKIPKPANNFEWCKQIVQGAFLSRATKTYFNDSTSLNGIKVYIAEFEGMDSGKLKYIQLFFINVRDSTIMGGINCDIKLKNDWMPTSEKILRSIKLN